MLARLPGAVVAGQRERQRAAGSVAGLPALVNTARYSVPKLITLALKVSVVLFAPGTVTHGLPNHRTCHVTVGAG